jgi:hypothetical protein
MCSQDYNIYFFAIYFYLVINYMIFFINLIAKDVFIICL